MEIKSCIFLFLNENKMVGYTHIWHKDSFIYGKSNKQTTYKQKKKKKEDRRTLKHRAKCVQNKVVQVS